MTDIQENYLVIFSVMLFFGSIYFINYFLNHEIKKNYAEIERLRSMAPASFKRNTKVENTAHDTQVTFYFYGDTLDKAVFTGKISPYQHLVMRRYLDNALTMQEVQHRSPTLEKDA